MFSEICSLVGSETTFPLKFDLSKSNHSITEFSLANDEVTTSKDFDFSRMLITSPTFNE